MSIGKLTVWEYAGLNKSDHTGLCCQDDCTNGVQHDVWVRYNGLKIMVSLCTEHLQKLALATRP